MYSAGECSLFWLGYLEDSLEKVEPELTGLCRMSKSEMDISVLGKEPAQRIAFTKTKRMKDIEFFPRKASGSCLKSAFGKETQWEKRT